MKPVQVLTALLFLPVAGLCLALAASAQGPQELDIQDFPLAVVGPDTVTTVDLWYELDFIKRSMKGRPPEDLPQASSILRRLVQNKLVVQEGYRMDLQDDFEVVNQVKEFIRHKAMAALLDSVAYAVDPDSVTSLPARTQAVKDFMAGLYRKYDVQVDSTLLKSLDYGSSDPQVAAYLRDSEDAVAILSSGPLKVRSLSKVIRFEAFHGLAGKPNAPELRDKFFREWLEEGLLSQEARSLGFDREPRLLGVAARMEENLVREKALEILLNVSFEPQDKEIEEFYAQHLGEVTPPPRIKMESVKLAMKESAVELREKLIGGAKMSWLRKNSPGVIEGADPFPFEWFAPDKLGIKPEAVELGLVPEPYGVPGAWVVARIAEIEDPAPLPLEECRTQILNLMKGEFLKAYLADVFSRLEAATEITVMPEAETRIHDILLATVESE